MDLYGIVIRSKDGFVILDEKSMVQSWGNTMIDNIDDSHPVLLRFKFPTNAKELRDFRLSLTYDVYRTYSSGDQVGSLSTSTGGDHTHLVSTHTGGPDLTNRYTRWTRYTDTVYGHSHALEYDYVSEEEQLRDHEHSRTTSEISGVEGSHKHTISNHKHGLSWGVYTLGYSSLTVDIYINNSLFMSDVGPKDSYNIPVSEEDLIFPGWNDIEIYSSEGNSRVNATYYTQIYIET